MGKKIILITAGVIVALALGFGIGMVIQNGGFSGIFGDKENDVDWTGQVVTTGANTANIYEKADVSSDIIYSMSPGEEATCVDYDEEWLKLEISEGVYGYGHTALFTLAGEAGSGQDSEQKEDPNAMKPADGYVTPNVQILDIYTDASEDSEIIGSVEFGSILQRLQASAEWTKIKTLDGKTEGFVKTASVNDQDYDPDSQVVEVTNKFVNLRSEATTDSEQLGRLVRGDTATYLGEEEGFYHIRTSDGIEGYVSMDYTRLVNAAELNNSESEAQDEEQQSEENAGGVNDNPADAEETEE